MCRMKTMFKSFALVAIAALSLAACSKNEAPINDENDLITLKFNIKNTDEASTRALLGDDNGKKFLNWENGDKIGTFSVGTFSSNTASNNNSGTVEVSGDNYTLNVQTFWSGTITNIYSYFPYSAAAGKDKTAAIVNIPGSQFMTTDGFDADAMPMAGTPVSVDLTTTAANTDTPCGTINFFNLGSIINFKIYSSIETDETLTSVKYVTGTGNLGGNYTVDLTAIDGADETPLALVGEGSEAEITTTHRATPVIGTGKANAIDVYMVVAPGSYSGTQVVVTTSAKTYTLNASGVKTYTRSSVKPMYVDIQNGTPGDLPVEETWTKVTKASDFTAGTYYILRGDGAYYLPNASATSGAPACVAYNAGDAITNAMKWTATAGDNGLIFESAANAGYYLWGADTNNGVRVAESSTANGASKEWKFTTVTVGETTYYTAYAFATRYLTSYGNQDWRNYTSASETNIPAEFYKLDVVDDTPSFTVESPLAATADEDTYTVNVTRNNFTGAITVTVPGDCDWVIAENVAENGTTFDVLVSENTGSARTVTLTLSGSGVESQELIINQAGKQDPVETEATIDFSAQGYSNAQEVSSLTQAPFTVTFTNGDTPTAYYDTGTAVRVYSGGTLKVSCADYKMTKIVIEGEANGGATLSSSPSGLSGQTWTGNANEVTFTAGTAKHYRFRKLTISYLAPGSATPSTPVITLSNLPTSNIAAAGDVVTINYSIENPASGVTVSASAGSDAWVNSFDYSTAGEISFVVDPKTTTGTRTATITVSYPGAEDKTFEITQSGITSGDDPVTIPMSVATYATNNSWENQQQYLTINLDANVTATAGPSTASNTGKYYTTDDTWRFYANENATLTIDAGTKTIESVTLTYTAKDNGTISKSGTSVKSGSAVSVNASSVAFTISQSSGNKGKIFITAISVTYK